MSPSKFQAPDLEKPSPVLAEDFTEITDQVDQDRKVTALDWDGPEDPDNPRTWSLRKRLFHSIIPGLFNFVV